MFQSSLVLMSVCSHCFSSHGAKRVLTLLMNPDPFSLVPTHTTTNIYFSFKSSSWWIACCYISVTIKKCICLTWKVYLTGPKFQKFQHGLALSPHPRYSYWNLNSCRSQQLNSNLFPQLWHSLCFEWWPFWSSLSIFVYFRNNHILVYAILGVWTWSMLQFPLDLAG